MPEHFEYRAEEVRAISDLLTAAATKPAALVVEGEAGIGKTTLWSETVDQAVERGFHVLSSCPAETESVYGYASLADLLTGVDAAVLDNLPPPQRVALDRFVLRAEPGDEGVDPRAIGAAFLTVIEEVAQTRPVLIAIDDLQWVDSPSAHAITFAARRVKTRVGMLGTARSDRSVDGALSWLELPAPDSIFRIRLRPLSLGRLHIVLREALGVQIPRPAMVKIHEISGGNPFYALELARSIDPRAQGGEVPMPRSLTELVRARIDGLTKEAHQLLLTAACLETPTVELLARAARTVPGDVIEKLAEAENSGIVEIAHNRVRFAHPVLARGVYCSATPARRRETHRHIGEVVREPELTARHRALGATRADHDTLQSLEEAAELARGRGAPAAAAELIELAFGLGGETPERRIQLADHHFAAGNAKRARALLEETIDQQIPQRLRARALTLLGVIAVLDEGFAEAEELLQRALGQAPQESVWRVSTLITLSFVQTNMGRIDSALATTATAVKEATDIGRSHLLGSALATRAMVGFMSGAGVDEAGLQRALELDDREANTALIVCPSMLNALLLAYSGKLDQAHNEMLDVWRRCADRDRDGERVIVGFNNVMIEIWRGNFEEAALVVEDVWERALALDAAFPKFVAHSCRALLAAYAGRIDEARRDLEDALGTGRVRDHFALASPAATLGFLEVSLGNYDAALAALRPLLSKLENQPRGMEIISASCVPDAVEAMIELKRLDEAEPFVEMLELRAAGSTVRGNWPSGHAAGACCSPPAATSKPRSRNTACTRRAPTPAYSVRARANTIAARADSAASAPKDRIHDLEGRAATFEELNIPLWADRAEALLDHTSIRPGRAVVLARPSDASPNWRPQVMTNRDVAAALSISTKTVEANLSRVYQTRIARSSDSR